MSDYENQGTGHDPHASGYELQGRDKKPKPTLPGFISWLETQPSDKTYDWSDPFNCVIAQYLKSIDVLRPDVTKEDDDYCKSYFAAQGSGFGLAFDRPWTFGAALERAKKALRHDQ